MTVIGNVSIPMEAAGLEDFKNCFLRICDWYAERVAEYIAARVLFQHFEMREHREMWE